MKPRESNPVEVLGGWDRIRANIAEIRKSPRLASEEEVAAVCDLAIEWLNEPSDDVRAAALEPHAAPAYNPKTGRLVPW